jgi:glycosyltransferase involved in cell wall biosynthesis
MRIAVANNFFPPRVGGSAHLSQALAARFAAAGHEVLVVTGSYGGAPPRENIGGYTVVRLPGWTLPKTRLAFNFDINFVSTPRNLKRLWRLLDDFRPDLIHQHGQFFDLTFLTAVYARRRSVPTVLSVHTRLEHTSRAANLVLAALDLTLVRSFVAIGRPHIVAMDKLMKGYIERRYHPRGDRVVAIPIGIDFNTVETAARWEVRQELGLDTSPIILSLGHVIPVRDRLALVNALPLILRRHPNALLVVVGAVYDARFLDRARELGVLEHVRTPGALPRDEIPAYLAAADVDAHDLSGYGLGTANLEAMAAGVPVIAAVDEDNFPGIDLRSWESLILVPPDDPDAIAAAIDRVITDAPARERLIEGQRALVSAHFTLDRVAEAHLALFARAITSRGL